MRNIAAVFCKQLKETFQNKAILIQFVMLPAMAVVMENWIQIQDMPQRFFVKLFSVMFVGMAPMTCISSIISEEKETGTLRCLLMSNVRPFQYFLGTGAYVWLLCMVSAGVLALCGKYAGRELWQFMAAMGIGILLSIFLGAIIGICAKDQMAATSVGIPVMMVFSFVPMLATFNKTIQRFAGIVYSQQLSQIIQTIGDGNLPLKNVALLAVNLALAALLFWLAFRKKGLE